MEENVGHLARVSSVNVHQDLKERIVTNKEILATQTHVKMEANVSHLAKRLIVFANLSMAENTVRQKQIPVIPIHVRMVEDVHQMVTNLLSVTVNPVMREGVVKIKRKILVRASLATPMEEAARQRA